MKNSLSTTKRPRRPRPLTPPTERDLHIYKLVKIQLREQWEVAYDHQIDRTRVSQILKRVDRWLAAGGDPADPALRDLAARQRLNRGTLQLRLARAVELASYALEFPQPSVTTKKRFHGINEVWREETTQDAPKLSLPALRTLLDASQAIQKLDDGRQATGHKSTGQKSTKSPEPLSDDEVLRLVFDLLLGLRLRAETQGHLPPHQNHRAIISQTLSTLLEPTATNSTASTLNMEPETWNSGVSPLTSPLPNPSPTPSNSSLTAHCERETSEPKTTTAMPPTTYNKPLTQPPEKVST